MATCEERPAPQNPLDSARSIDPAASRGLCDMRSPVIVTSLASSTSCQTCLLPPACREAGRPARHQFKSRHETAPNHGARRTPTEKQRPAPKRRRERQNRSANLHGCGYPAIRVILASSSGSRPAKALNKKHKPGFTAAIVAITACCHVSRGATGAAHVGETSRDEAGVLTRHLSANRNGHGQQCPPASP